MTETEFKNRSFKFNMRYDYKSPRTGALFECLLMAVDFEKGVIQLWPIPLPEDSDFFYSKEEFWVTYEYCHLPKQKLKTV